MVSELAVHDGARSNTPPVISHLSSGDYAVDEDTFQSTMKYIFTFIEKVPRIPLQFKAIVLTLCTGETSRKYRRETLPTLSPHR